MKGSRRWAGWEPLELTVPCGDRLHRLRWEAGSLLPVDHDHGDGGCEELRARWSRFAGDPAVLAVIEGEQADHAVTALLALGEGLRDRLVAGIAITWADRLAADPSLDAPDPIAAAVHRRAGEVLGEWWGDEVEVTVEPAIAGATLVDDAGWARFVVGVAWLADVWCRGLALIGEDFFVLGVKDVRDDRLVVDAVDSDLYDLEIDIARPLVPLRTSPPGPPLPSVTGPGGPVWATKLYVTPDYGQLYLSVGGNDVWPDGALPMEAAYRDAVGTRRFVGVADGALVLIFMPCEGHPWTRVFVEVWAEEPALDRVGWDHEVDLDLDVSGRIALSGCIQDWRVGADVPPGRYRARISCGDYAGAAARTSGGVYRLRLWPRTDDLEPRLRRSWPGWETLRTEL